MRVGVPKEVKSHENRVGLVPAAAEEFDHHGHQVIVESEAGREIGFSDDDYRAAGAEIAPDAKVVFATADLIVAGVAPGKIVILGGGVSGTHAARMAMGIEASVTVIDKSLRRLSELNTQYGARLQTLFATVQIIEREVRAADLVIGAVLVPGAAAPKLVRRETVRQMKRGAAIVDISIDQGGCFETNRPTTHAAPTYETEGVIHYCVTNMPGAVAKTSTFALNNATLPFALASANRGWKRALDEDVHLRNGLNVYDGHITHPAVASALGLPAKGLPSA